MFSVSPVSQGHGRPLVKDKAWTVVPGLLTHWLHCQPLEPLSGGSDSTVIPYPWVVTTLSLKEYPKPPLCVWTIQLSYIVNRLEFAIFVGTLKKQDSFFSMSTELKSFFFSFIQSPYFLYVWSFPFLFLSIRKLQIYTYIHIYMCVCVCVCVCECVYIYIHTHFMYIYFFPNYSSDIRYETVGKEPQSSDPTWSSIKWK